MLSNNFNETIYVFCILQEHFLHGIENVITFENAARNIENTRGNLPIQKSTTYETTLEAGFTPAQFLASSFILVENEAFTKLLLPLLEKRLRLPWTMKHSIRPFPVWSDNLNKSTPKPYNILQVLKARGKIAEVNQKNVTAQSQVAQWNAFPLDVYGLPCDDRKTNNTRWTPEELTLLRTAQELPIRVYCLHQDDFRDDIGNILPFYTAVKQVKNTRGDLPISRTFLYDTNILIGFTPAHFLRSSFIQVENAAFATLLMPLLQRRLNLPWTMKQSIKHFPQLCNDDNKYQPQPYHILQVQNIEKHTER
jgi:hypothetical protein